MIDVVYGTYFNGDFITDDGHYIHIDHFKYKIVIPIRKTNITFIYKIKKLLI
jgi:hypothetical protein